MIAKNSILFDWYFHSIALVSPIVNLCEVPLTLIHTLNFCPISTNFDFLLISYSLTLIRIIAVFKPSHVYVIVIYSDTITYVSTFNSSNFYFVVAYPDTDVYVAMTTTTTTPTPVVLPVEKVEDKKGSKDMIFYVVIPVATFLLIVAIILLCLSCR